MEKRKPAKNFQELAVWQKAHRFVLEMYRLTTSFPRQETYGLTNQMRCAAASIPSNIAEGFKRRGRADKARFMNIAQGSIEECRYYLILTQDLKYGAAKPLIDQLEEVAKLLDSHLRAIVSASNEWPS